MAYEHEKSACMATLCSGAHESTAKEYFCCALIQTEDADVMGYSGAINGSFVRVHFVVPFADVFGAWTKFIALGTKLFLKAPIELILDGFVGGLPRQVV